MMKKLLILMAWVVCTATSLWQANAQQKEFDVVVNLSDAGKLYDEAPPARWEETATSVKIIGKLNSSDLRTLRQFCGSDEYGASYPHGSVRRIDLSEATIVPGGIYYIRVDDQGTMREYVVDKDKPNMLPDKLFYMCTSIESLTLPKNITSIGIGAFWKCIKLKEIIIPDEVTHIYATAFGVCDALGSIKLPSKLTHLGNYAFTYCKSLKELTIPEGVKEMHRRVFEQTPSLKAIHLPKTMDSFDEDAFYGAVGLEEITIPEGIGIIPKSCFGYCRVLNKVTFPATVSIIEDQAFEDDTALKTIVFGEGLREIKIAAFRNCAAIDKLNISNGLQKIANEVFSSCTGVKEIHFGTELKEIGEKAFWHNHSLEKVAFPENLELIDYAAFSECKELREVDFGKSKAQLVQNPFLGCFALERFTVDAGNTAFSVHEDVLYSSDRKKLYSYPNARSNKVLKMPEETIETDDFSLWFCTNLEGVEFSPNFAKMGARTFCGSKNIKQITVKTATPIENKYSDDPFEGLSRSACTLFVPKGSKDAYATSPLWKDFSIVEAETTALDLFPEKAQAKLCTTPEGWELINLPNECKEARLMSIDGQTLAVAAPQYGKVVFAAPSQGKDSYIVVVLGGTTPLVFKAIR